MERFKKTLHIKLQRVVLHLKNTKMFVYTMFNTESCAIFWEFALRLAYRDTSIILSLWPK